MTFEDKFIAAAMSFYEPIPTPWLHTGRLKGVGIDCVGLVICSINEAGGEIEDTNDYTRFDEFEKLVRILNIKFEKVKRKPRRGDILMFRGSTIHNHIAIYLGEIEGIESFIHAYSGNELMRTAIEPFNGYWKMNLKGVYRYRGMD